MSGYKLYTPKRYAGYHIFIVKLRNCDHNMPNWFNDFLLQNNIYC